MQCRVGLDLTQGLCPLESSSKILREKPLHIIFRNRPRGSLFRERWLPFQFWRGVRGSFLRQSDPIVGWPPLSQHAAEEMVRVIAAAGFPQRVLIIDPGVD